MLLCGLLIAVVAFEVVHTPGAETQAEPGNAAPRPVALRGTRSAPSNARPNTWMEEALARPLFAPDRRPAAGSATADPGMPRLTGIIASPDAAVAIFQPAGSTRSVLARSGEHVAGWEVTAIAADAVNLRKQGQVIVLSPRFGGAQHGGLIQQAQLPKPRWEEAAPTGLERARWSNPQLQP
jgi:general secretion pathway protein N